MKLNLIKSLKSFVIPTMAAMALCLGIAGCSSSGDGENPDAEMAEGNNAADAANSNATLNNNVVGNEAGGNPAGGELQNLVTEGGAESAGEAPPEGGNAGADPFAAQADPNNPVPNAPPENALNGANPVTASDDESEEEGAASVAGTVPELGTKVAYYVSTGDTLGTIAQKIYGNKAKWKEIAQTNNITNPNKIFAGDVIYYSIDEKSKEFASAYEGAPRKTVTVASGDTLSGIAAKVYGSQGVWRKLWKENGHIKNPDLIKVGTVLTYRVTNATAEIELELEDDEDQVLSDKSGEAELNQDSTADMVVTLE